ncbi:hypothetical protein PENSPDRAFT_197642 [Peniophora sp. CONT]|nr:hypothetical protein PENSPDRAFT_197642 [Peniophora sp. CONT]
MLPGIAPEWRSLYIEMESHFELVIPCRGRDLGPLSVTMSLPILNATQEAQVLEVLFKSTASSVAPLLLLESFTTGVFCACVPLASHIVWIKSVISIPRAPSIAMLWVVLVVMITHWALSLQHFESTLAGRSLGISLSDDDLWGAINNFTIGDTGDLIGYSHVLYGEAWQYLLPLITETVLLGFASSLFVLTAYKSFWRLRSQRRSCLNAAIPALASLMYTLSLAHWAVTLRCFMSLASAGATVTAESFSVDTYALDLTLLILLSCNAVLSDSIVLWRMYVVWERARPLLVLGVALLSATLGLNIANVVANALYQLNAFINDGVSGNKDDTEILPTYGVSHVGLAAAFLSLASNLCATTLVGIRVWLYRKQFSKDLRFGNHRTLVERFLEILVDSGVVYTAIWLLYCISFFRPITSYNIFSPGPTSTYPTVTAAAYLDAAMAQLTSIYPLIVFTLVALDKVHHSRGSQTLHNDTWPKERGTGVTVTLEIDVERSTAPNGGQTASYPMVVFPGTDDRPPTMDDMKHFVSRKP